MGGFERKDLYSMRMVLVSDLWLLDDGWGGVMIDI